MRNPYSGKCNQVRKESGLSPRHKRVGGRFPLFQQKRDCKNPTANDQIILSRACTCRFAFYAVTNFQAQSHSTHRNVHNFPRKSRLHVTQPRLSLRSNRRLNNNLRLHPLLRTLHPRHNPLHPLLPHPFLPTPEIQNLLLHPLNTRLPPRNDRLRVSRPLLAPRSI